MDYKNCTVFVLNTYLNRKHHSSQDTSQTFRKLICPNWGPMKSSSQKSEKSEKSVITPISSTSTFKQTLHGLLDYEKTF